VVKTNAVRVPRIHFSGHQAALDRPAFGDFKHHVRKLTGRSWGVSMAYRLDKLARYVRGWMGYFVSRTPTASSRRLTTGCGSACGCATGSSGGGCAPRSAISWRWAPRTRQAILTALKLQELLAPVANLATPVRDDQRLAGTPGPGIRACVVASSPWLRLIPRVASTFVNRLSSGPAC